MKRIAPAALLVSALVGFAMSSWLVGQYLMAPSHGSCPLDGGCQAVRTCVQLGVPPFFMPPLGVLGFLTLTLLAQSRNPARRRYLLPVGVASGLVGSALLVSQKFVCGGVCPYCVVADLAGICAAVFALSGGAETKALPAHVGRWAAGGIVASILVAAGWTVLQMNAPVHPTRVATLPPMIQQEQRPGAVTVIDVHSFECPHCRAEHAILDQLVMRFGHQIRIVQVHPVLRLSHGAIEAARAAICAEAQNHAQEMADAMFAEMTHDRASVDAAARRIGLDTSAFDSCLDSDATRARLQHDVSLQHEAHIGAVPALFIGHDRYEGTVVPLDELVRSVEHEIGASVTTAAAAEH